jgi:uncharacterized membrane protein HdeD (DUF308 family)
MKNMAKKMDLEAVMKKQKKECRKMMAYKMLVIGVLILINSAAGLLSWANFIGGLLAIAGILKLVLPDKLCK